MKTKTHLKPTMKSLFISLALLATALAAHAQSWTNTYDSMEPYALVTDDMGNIIVTGSSLSFVCITVKYSPSGTLLWATNYSGSYSGSGMENAGYAVATDKSGNVFVAGSTSENGNNVDFVTLKYSPAGALLWRRFYAGPGSNADRAFGVTVDSSGNAIVTGLRPDAGYTAFSFVTLKYSTNGALLWTRSFPAGYVDWFSLKPIGVAVDYEDNIVVWGTKANSSAPPYDRDFVTLKYSAAGVPL
jgi:hypothetical protein